MAAHRIELRGPWDVEPLDMEPDLPSRVQLPATWAEAFAGFTGSVRLRRRFHRPTNLESPDLIRIVCVAPGQGATVTLNGKPLGTFDAHTGETVFEIASVLQQSNQLLLELEPPVSSRTPLWRSFAIEIISE